MERRLKLPFYIVDKPAKETGERTRIMDYRTDMKEFRATLELLEMRVQMLLVCCDVITAFEEYSKAKKRKQAPKNTTKGANHV